MFADSLAKIEASFTALNNSSLSKRILIVELLGIIFSKSGYSPSKSLEERTVSPIPKIICFSFSCTPKRTSPSSELFLKFHQVPFRYYNTTCWITFPSFKVITFLESLNPSVATRDNEFFPKRNKTPVKIGLVSSVEVANITCANAFTNSVLGKTNRFVFIYTVWNFRKIRRVHSQNC